MAGGQSSGFFNLYEDDDSGFDAGNLYPSLREAEMRRCRTVARFVCTVRVDRVDGRITHAEIYPTN